MIVPYNDWITNYPEGAAQDDPEMDESRDEELWMEGDDYSEPRD